MTGANSTFLIVDDDECQRWLLQKAVESVCPHCTVHALGSGNDAVAYLKGQGKYGDRSIFHFPSCIITDLKMPDGDGFDILDFLRANAALSVVPVVILSCSDDPDDVRKAYLLGASSYFVKPMGQPALEALVRRIHDYWMDCKVPAVDAEGYALKASSKGKVGERFARRRDWTADAVWSATGVERNAVPSTQ